MLLHSLSPFACVICPSDCCFSVDVHGLSLQTLHVASRHSSQVPPRLLEVRRPEDPRGPGQVRRGRHRHRRPRSGVSRRFSPVQQRDIPLQRRVDLFHIWTGAVVLRLHAKGCHPPRRAARPVLGYGWERRLCQHSAQNSCDGLRGQPGAHLQGTDAF